MVGAVGEAEVIHPRLAYAAPRMTNDDSKALIRALVNEMRNRHDAAAGPSR